jgi:hypothetical protein
MVSRAMGSAVKLLLASERAGEGSRKKHQDNRERNSHHLRQKLGRKERGREERSRVMKKKKKTSGSRTEEQAEESSAGWDRPRTASLADRFGSYWVRLIS